MSTLTPSAAFPGVVSAHPHAQFMTAVGFGNSLGYGANGSAFTHTPATGSGFLNAWSAGFSRFRQRVGDLSIKVGHAIFMGADIFSRPQAPTAPSQMMQEGEDVFTQPLLASSTSPDGDVNTTAGQVGGSTPGQPDPSGDQKGAWTRFINATFKAPPGEHQWATPITVLFGVTELTLFASGIAWLTGAGIELFDPSASPVFNKPTLWQVGKLAMNC
ncbi:MAG: hypothetical protein HN337_05645, partial [Deltaproteobacteria bacterium]|nr:hypothetical protein [Deltaproteobacteria bacterium]